MTEFEKQKNPSRVRAGAESTERSAPRMKEQGECTATPAHGMRLRFPGLVEPFPGRAARIHHASTHTELAEACMRYAAARFLLRTMRGQLPDLAGDVVENCLVQHVRKCKLRPRPSPRQISRAVEVALAFVEREAGEVHA